MKDKATSIYKCLIFFLMKTMYGGDDDKDDGDSRQCLLKLDMYWTLGTSF